MNKTYELITLAENMGIRTYYQGGLKVDTPWPINAMPDSARYVLGELKKKQPAVLAYLAIADIKPDFQLRLEALRALGLHISYDPVEEVKIHCKPILDEYLQIAGVILDTLLRNYYRELVQYLMSHPQPPPVPG